MLNLNELAQCTGLTTRTLRNYMSMGILHGEKVDGKWQFSEEALDALLRNPYVKPSIRSGGIGMVEDFLNTEHKKENQMCVVIDCMITAEEAPELSKFFCNKANAQEGKLCMKYSQDGPYARILLSGAEEAVLNCLMEYKQKFAR